MCVLYPEDMDWFGKSELASERLGSLFQSLFSYAKGRLLDDPPGAVDA